MEVTIEFDNLKDLTVSRLKEIVYEIRSEMATLAREQLSPPTAEIYVNGLSNIDEVGNEVNLYLNGFLPTGLEDGIDAFDMRPGLLASSKAKISKTGNVYIRIPMGNGFNNPYHIVTLSSKTPASKWQYPGIDGYNFMSQALEKI